MKDKSLLDEFIKKCIEGGGKYCIDSTISGAVVVYVPSCCFVMNNEQFEYFFKSLFKAFS